MNDGHDSHMCVYVTDGMMSLPRIRMPRVAGGRRKETLSASHLQLSHVQLIQSKTTLHCII